MHIDVTRAYLYANASRDFYVKLPAEDQVPGGEHMCGKLNTAMSGTGDAVQNWQTTCTETMRELGFNTGRVSPCHFHHQSSDTCGMVHSDDFVFAGTEKFLRKARHTWRGISASR